MTETSPVPTAVMASSKPDRTMPIIPENKPVPPTNEILPTTQEIPTQTPIPAHTHSPLAITESSPISQIVPVYTAQFTKETEAALKRCEVDTNYVNPVPLNFGANHVVFSMDEPGKKKRVIKITKEKSVTTMTEGHKGERENFELARSYFSEKYIPHTDVKKDPQSDFFCVVQDTVTGKEITNLSIKNKMRLKQQLQEIVSMNNKLYREKKMTLDFIGMSGFTGWIRKQFGKFFMRKSEFPVSNILVDEEGNLKIIDFEFFDLKEEVGIKKQITNWIGMTANRILMNHYFGLDIKERE